MNGYDVCERLTTKTNIVNMTASELRELLATPEYLTVPIVVETVSYEDRKKIALYESVNNFGSDVACLFEDLCEELHRVPTQQEYTDRGILVTENWWISELQRKDSMLRGLQFEGCILQAVRNRLSRGYLSLVNEIYTVALLKELYPNAKVIIQ